MKILKLDLYSVRKSSVEKWHLLRRKMIFTRDIRNVTEIFGLNGKPGSLLRRGAVFQEQ